MAINPIVHTEKIVRSFLKYQFSAYPFSDPRLNTQMRELLSVNKVRRTPLLRGPYISLSRGFREGVSVQQLIGEGVFHPHMRQLIPAEISNLYGHQERAIRAVHAGTTTLVGMGTGSGKTECLLDPIISTCLKLKDAGAEAGISAVIVYPMNALAEDQLDRLRGLLAGSGISFGMYVGKTPEHERDVAGQRMPAGSSRADYEAVLKDYRDAGRADAVHPVEGVRQLKASGDLDNTLIVFLSDNGACYEWGPFGFDGESRRGTTTLRTGDTLRETGGRGTHQSYGSAWANLGNTPFRLYKHFTYEGGICTPCIVHWPKGTGTPDAWIRQAAHVMDIMPTLIEAAGASYPATFSGNAIQPMEGTSLLPAMRGENLPERGIGFDHQGARAYRKGDWKLVWSKRMPHEIRWELYNLAEDRCETNDLAAQYPDRVHALAAEWEQWARRVDVIHVGRSTADAAQD